MREPPQVMHVCDQQAGNELRVDRDAERFVAGHWQRILGGGSAVSARRLGIEKYQRRFNLAARLRLQCSRDASAHRESGFESTRDRDTARERGNVFVERPWKCSDQIPGLSRSRQSTRLQLLGRQYLLIDWLIQVGIRKDNKCDICYSSELASNGRIQCDYPVTTALHYITPGPSKAEKSSQIQMGWDDENINEIPPLEA